MTSQPKEGGDSMESQIRFRGKRGHKRHGRKGR